MKHDTPAFAARRPLAQRTMAIDLAPVPLAILSLAGLMSVLGWLARRRKGWLAAGLLSQAGMAALLWLFRNPVRRPVTDAGVVLSPCDGVVSQITLSHEPTFLGAVSYCIALRVRLRDAQVVYAPVSGIVRLRRWQPKTLSSEPDDALWIGIRHDDGCRVLTRFTTSPLWRPLPSHWTEPLTYGPDLEDSVQTGQIVGHLPLGGMLTVYVPATAQITVGPGQRVRASETPLARL